MISLYWTPFEALALNKTATPPNTHMRLEAREACFRLHSTNGKGTTSDYTVPTDRVHASDYTDSEKGATLYRIPGDVFEYVYVCACVCICICMYVYVCKFMHMYVYVCICM